NSFTLYAVSGNMDPPEIRSAWPDKRVVELDGFRFGLTHGWGSPFGLDKRVLNQMPEVDCVCFGHSHRPLNKRRGDVLLFNPGAARSGFMSGSTYGRLTVGPEGISGQHLPF
ncbi:MAG: metallophosphoesterase family protein, partial [Deltaproteobacteria bacterium]|nr:metallophosphoesterase family protein [Deltaproteobacteria bacterium]